MKSLNQKAFFIKFINFTDSAGISTRSWFHEKLKYANYIFFTEIYFFYVTVFLVRENMFLTVCQNICDIFFTIVCSFTRKYILISLIIYLKGLLDIKVKWKKHEEYHIIFKKVYFFHWYMNFLFHPNILIYEVLWAKYNLFHRFLNT